VEDGGVGLGWRSVSEVGGGFRGGLVGLWGWIVGVGIREGVGTPGPFV